MDMCEKCKYEATPHNEYPCEVCIQSYVVYVCFEAKESTED